MDMLASTRMHEVRLVTCVNSSRLELARVVVVLN